MFIILSYQNVVGPFQRIFISGQEKHDVVASILSQQGFSERLVCIGLNDDGHLRPGFPGNFIFKSSTKGNWRE